MCFPPKKFFTATSGRSTWISTPARSSPAWRASSTPTPSPDTFARAHVNSVTLTAKCHHGMCYYPTQTGRPHPALWRARPARRTDRRAPPRAASARRSTPRSRWEEDAAARHPDWRQLRRGRHFADAGLRPARPTRRWKFLNFLHPEYQDYIETHLRELCARYGKEVDGFFLDIVIFHPDACWSETSVRFRENPRPRRRRPRRARALPGRRAGRLRRTLHAAPPRPRPAGRDRFLQRRPMPLAWTAASAPGARYGLMTHAEIESLPSRPVGLPAFPPRRPRHRQLGQPVAGHDRALPEGLGRLRRPQAARRAGIRMFPHPGPRRRELRRRPASPARHARRDAYALIGSVYEQCEAAEAFYAGSRGDPAVRQPVRGLPRAGPRTKPPRATRARCSWPRRSHRDVAMIDERADLSDFELVQLPDSVVVTPLLGREAARVLRGGRQRCSLSYRAGFDAAGRVGVGLPAAELSATSRWPKFPTYWRARPGDGGGRGRHGPRLLHGRGGSAGRRGRAGARGAGAAVFPAHGRGVFLAFPDAARGRGGRRTRP